MLRAAAADLQYGLRGKWLGDIFKRGEGTASRPPVSREVGVEEEGGGCVPQPPQIVRYHMSTPFYQRLWKGAGAGTGKEKGRKGR